MRIDLNADVGESFGVYTLAHDAALMPHITSANVACGFHGGCSGKARHNTATAPPASAVRQATRAPEERPPKTSAAAHNVARWISERALASPAQLAVADPWRRLDYRAFDDRIARDLPSLMDTYRALHAAPELSMQEAKTSAFLASRLRELGYEEGKTIIIEYRTAAGNRDRIPGIVAELAQLQTGVIVWSATQEDAKEIKTIPIVYVGTTDFVATGLVKSLARPGGNITGITSLAPDLGGKRLELLKETVPKVSRAAVLMWKPAGPDYGAEKSEIENAARALRVELQPLEVGSANELENAFSSMAQGGANAFLGLTDTRFANNRKRIIDLVLKNRLPAAYQDRVFVEAGGLMSYGANIAHQFRRAAAYVDRILKGARPAKVVDLDRVVHYQINRDERLDDLWVLSHPGSRAAHCRKVTEQWNAGEILQQHARRRERDFLLHVRAGRPPGEHLDVGGIHKAAVLVPEEIFQKNFE